LFVCGHNTKLRDRLQKAFAGSPHSVRVLGYVDHVHELMALADLIVTKPGGLTTSEAVASELPMLLYKPLPGQEQDNAAYLVSAGLAKQAANIGELTEQLINLFQNPQILTTIKKRARQFQMKSATQHAATVIAGTRSTTLPIRALTQPALIRG
jgi:processive 1,2-diacylglycerol beta-glucosyltransferase